MIFQSVKMILPRFFDFERSQLSPWANKENLRYRFVATSMLNKYAYFCGDSPSDRKVKFNLARAIELSEASDFVYNFGASFDQLFLRIFF